MTWKHEIDGRHHVSNKMLISLKSVAYSQDDFGMEKYKNALNPSMKYDWLKMATEELVDMAKYLECEAERKAVVTGMLRSAVNREDWELVKYALQQLEMDGTGKEEQHG